MTNMTVLTLTFARPLSERNHIWHVLFQLGLTGFIASKQIWCVKYLPIFDLCAILKKLTANYSIKIVVPLVADVRITIDV